MKVSISSASPFHSFDLARQVEKHGSLDKLYTAFPLRRVQGVPQSRVASFPWFMTPMKGLQKVGLTPGMEHLNWLTIATFDRWVAGNLGACDILHHWSSCGTVSQQAMKQRWNAAIVCERGSSHISFQDGILADEHRRWEMPYRSIDHRIVERELHEYQGADCIIVPSHFAARSFVEQGVGRDKLEVVPLGVDLSMFHPVPKADHVFRILYVGQMSLRKGLPYVLEAVCGLGRSDVEFWLIGSMTPEADPFFKRYCGCFKYLGTAPRHELHQYYSQASVLVLASLEEGMAMVQAQAMACGLPVISTINAGAEDLFQDSVEGFIVPIRSPTAIQEKIHYLYENPDHRAEMGQAAMRRVQSLGGWDTYGERVMEVYNKLLPAGPR